MVDTYVAGLKAKADASTAKIYEVAGGKDKLEELHSWASENLSVSQRDAYNAAMDASLQSGDTAGAEMAIRGLQAMAKEARGPQLNTGGTAPTGGDVVPFASQKHFIDAINDPRYETDSVYRKKLEMRLAATNNIQGI